MGATGEDVRRVSDRGFHPAWSADAKELGADTSDFLEPEGDLRGQLVVIDVATGSTRVMSELTDVLAPLVTQWTPHRVLGEAGKARSETSGPSRHQAACRQSQTMPPPTGIPSGRPTGAGCSFPAIAAEA